MVPKVLDICHKLLWDIGPGGGGGLIGANTPEQAFRIEIVVCHELLLSLIQRRMLTRKTS